MITKEQVATSEQQIYMLRKNVRYDIRELIVEIMVSKYQKGLDYQEDDDFLDKSTFYSVLFIPDYQRDFTWDNVRQSRFIESILLGLPIPLVFVAENKHGAWEIVDRSQRIRTLHAFLNNKLTLNSLEKIDALNGFQFKDLDVSRQSKFIGTPLRMIVLSEDANDEVKRDMFERINRGSDLLKPMEKRKGDKTGKFTDFIYAICASEDKVTDKYQEVNTLLRELAPIDKWLENRQEREELVLRYFALSDSDRYKHFPRDTGIAKFLDAYLENKNTELNLMNENQLDTLLQKYLDEFFKMLKFVKQYSTYGFRITHNPQTKRVIFESISVGVYVALKQNSDLSITTEKMTNILNSNEFRKYWQGNTKVHESLKVKERIELITNQLLG